MNTIQIVGNIGNIELKATPSGKQVVVLSVYTNRGYKDANGQPISDRHTVVFWEKQAEVISQWFSKGDMIALEGELQYRSFNNQDNQTVRLAEIRGNRFHFVGQTAKSSQTNQRTGTDNAPAPASKPNRAAPAPQPMEDDLDCIPF